jgi:serine/threonine protein kinase
MRFTYALGDRPLDGYTIQQGLGRGGFGEVYQAVSDGGKQVALKLVQRNLDVELRGVSQCINLKHPNLVSVHDVKQAENGDQWIIMEFVAGETLDKIIARHPQGMPQDQALIWLKGICEGVGYLHEQGIVHRDLKPGNTFLENLSQVSSPSRTGRTGRSGGEVVKIGDYGLSKFISASRRSGQTTSIGTVHYMAPEVVKGRYGKEVDLYAVGVILYEMLTGRVPFTGESPGEILMKHLTDLPDLTALPLAFRPVVARLLDKDPYRRYSSAISMMADLEGYLARPPDAELAEPVRVPDSRTRGAPASLPAGELRAFALDLNRPASDPQTDPQKSWWKQLDPYSAMGWLFLISACLGLGIGGLIGVQWYDPVINNQGEAWVMGGSVGSLLAGGVLLLLMFFQWAGKFADPDTVRKFMMAVRSGRDERTKFELERLQREKSERLSKAVGAVVGGVTVAVVVGLGLGLLVAGAYLTTQDATFSGVGVAIVASGAGLLAFGATATALLFFRKRWLHGGEGHNGVSAAAEIPTPPGKLVEGSAPPSPRPGTVSSVLAKLTLASSIAIGVGLMVGGGTTIFADNARVSTFGGLLGCSVGLIVFGAMAYGWIFDKHQRPREEPGDVHAAQRETPLSRSDVPLETGPWQPQSEHVRQ